MKIIPRSYLPLLLLLSLALPSAPSVAADAPKPVGPSYGVFRDLPVTDITPQGWLADFLGRQRDGLGAITRSEVGLFDLYVDGQDCQLSFLVRLRTDSLSNHGPIGAASC